MKSYNIYHHHISGRSCIIQYDQKPGGFIETSTINLPNIKRDGYCIYAKDNLYLYRSCEENILLWGNFNNLMIASIYFDVLPDADTSAIFELADIPQDVEILIRKTI